MYSRRTLCTAGGPCVQQEDLVYSNFKRDRCCKRKGVRGKNGYQVIWDLVLMNTFFLPNIVDFKPLLYEVNQILKVQFRLCVLFSLLLK